MHQRRNPELEGPMGAVNDRYAHAAREREEALCCPVKYDPRYLDAIPGEVLDRDYGCGDPSRHVRPGETVLDLGSGGGKICFIAAQIVGAEGQVIGVDANPEMLALARRSAPRVAEQIGFGNVRFLRGHIQDLALDLDALNRWLGQNPVSDVAGVARLEAQRADLRHTEPLIPDESVDLVVSNCVLNLVRDADKRALVQEIYRVLRPGGRIAISDIVADEPVPAEMKADPELWSGCISGAFGELEILEELARAGFHGMAIDGWEDEPFQVVEGIEFRSLTVTAHKGKEGTCWEANQALIYRGPWSAVHDDDGHVFRRGERTAVCAKTFDLLTREPYPEQFVAVQPRVGIPDAQRKPFDCSRTAPRHPRETKGLHYKVSTEAREVCCEPGSDVQEQESDGPDAGNHCC